jgi:polysaccharide export outer membrane protein
MFTGGKRASRWRVGGAPRRVWLLVPLVCGLTGCHTLWQRNKFLEQSVAPNTTIPHELAKTTMPSYRIEPPDVLLIDAVKIVPKEPYSIEPLDLLTILVEGTPPESPILGEFRVDSEGTIILGPGYGRVRVEGLTIDEAQRRIEEHLSTILATPEVSVSLAEPAASQSIEGDHIVSQDGTIHLGIYGNIRVVGMTVAQAQAAIEKHLSQFLEDPQVAVDVAAYNSKVYYVILQGAGQGDEINRFPITGNETVLDALGQIDGLSPNQSTNMWIARPAPSGMGCDQILPIDWQGISQGGATSTNYQLLPGDRLFVAEDKWMAFNTVVTKVTAPFERLLGFTTLGTQTVQTINRSPTGYRGSRGILAAAALAGS